MTRPDAEAIVGAMEEKRVSKRMAAYSFLAEHLSLNLGDVQDADGNIDESFVVVEERSDLLVFGAENPYPKDAVTPNTPLPK